MAVLSVCRQALLPLRQPFAISKRFGGHGHTMRVRPSQYQWKKTKDIWHFYFLVGAIPLGLTSLYLSIFYGNAQLREIPEGYEPEPYEYERNPVTRFLVKYFYPDRKEMYERKIYYLSTEMENMLINQIINRADYLMSIRRDYKAWYYRDFSAKMTRYAREHHQNLEFQRGIQNDYSDEKLD
ncbi:NADH dehydrogenase [ubiquinone] 1 beta subcomplex subunit 5-like protein [Leptotrombidium deliense]|uniref:NADH dehydrogenase [ubiquinone] 1 beta subcomplex subunit 5, mitochondrial n=1 Tax=Leptotrombidium deliense TaxID=299467 RepID=A0A443SP13_9ACAR|nr:NADH dehydrogenase [ubiquinone] 1 beta subcomplex subunit 5-like protein [Leptotrombidium deliense]